MNKLFATVGPEDVLTRGAAYTFAYALVVGLLIWIDLRASRANLAAPRSLPAAFLTASLGYILLCRFPVLRYDPIINPDEALMAANAMRTRYGWLNWDIVDPLTSGPLNSAILAWPYLFGGDITLYSTRLTGIACVFGVSAFLFLTLRKLADNRTAIIATAPSVLFFGSTTMGDFIRYSSEQLPILLLALALFLFARSFTRNSLGEMLGAAFVLGLVPFAKLQAGPLAATIGVFVLARGVVTGNSLSLQIRRAAFILGAAILPALIFLGPLALSGGLDDVFKSYLLQQQMRFGAWSDPIPGMVRRAKLFFALAGIYFVMLAAAGLHWLLVRLRGGARRATSPALRWHAALAVALLPVGHASIILPGRNFTHYFLLAVPALILLGGSALAALAQSSSTRRWGWQAGLFGVSLVIMLPMATLEQGRKTIQRNDGAFLQGEPFEASHILSWLRPTPEDSMLCWGWGPECYLNSAMRAATRDSNSENQIYDMPLRDYFRSRFISDFGKSNPDFIVDLVAPGSFGFKDPATQGLQTFPALAGIVARDFELVSRVEPPGRCPRLYVRRTRLAELNKSRIEFASLAASAAEPGHEASALDDGSVFESCSDNWLLPKGELGSATIRFRQASAVETVAILNTRRTDERRVVAGSEEVELSLLLGDSVARTERLSLRPYPHWTIHKLAEPVEADGLSISILSFRGSGGGLNEVKAYRD